MSLANERLRAARVAAGFATARDAAKHFGWVDSTYRGHEAGPREISKKAALKYSRAFNVSLSWLLKGTDEERTGETNGNENDRRDRLIGLRILPIVKPEAVEQMQRNDPDELMAVAVGKASVANIELSQNSAAMEVYDNSMSPTLIKGDLVIYDAKAEIEPEDVVVAHVKGEKRAIVRRFGLGEENKIILTPDNESWGEPKAIPKDDLVFTWRVVTLQREL